MDEKKFYVFKIPTLPLSESMKTVVRRMLISLVPSDLPSNIMTLSWLFTNRCTFLAFQIHLLLDSVRAWNLFQSSSSSSLPTWDDALLQAATRVRRQIVGTTTTSCSRFLPPIHDTSALAFDASVYYKNGTSPRGFCNWLLPGRVMVGQYPAQTPERDGPSSDEVEQHITALVHTARINFFCSLQSEIPAQTDDHAWEQHNGQIYLPDYLRDDFPRPFTHYAPLVRRAAAKVPNIGEPTFLHSPIPDLNVPSSKPLHKLLLQLLQALEVNDDDDDDDIPNAIYLHCWGGRGRAGLVGACLVSLIYPELDAHQVLRLVQNGYDSRAGAAQMPRPLQRSPQTASQREFVIRFVQERQRQVPRE